MSEAPGKAKAKPAALVVLSLAAPASVLVFVGWMPAGDAVFAFCAAVFPVALMALGASRGGRLGPTAWGIGLLLVILIAVMIGLFMFRGRVAEGPWWGGLPAAAAIQLYGLFLAPLLLTCCAYAWTFDSWGLRQQDLDDLRQRFPNAKEPEAP